MHFYGIEFNTALALALALALAMALALALALQVASFPTREMKFG